MFRLFPFCLSNIDWPTHIHRYTDIYIHVTEVKRFAHKWKTHLTCLFLGLEFLRIETVEQQRQEQVQNHEISHDQSGQKYGKTCGSTLL